MVSTSDVNLDEAIAGLFSRGGRPQLTYHSTRDSAPVNVSRVNEH
jgi:hypothetical protein